MKNLSTIINEAAHNVPKYVVYDGVVRYVVLTRKPMDYVDVNLRLLGNIPTIRILVKTEEGYAVISECLNNNPLSVLRKNSTKTSGPEKVKFHYKHNGYDSTTEFTATYMSCGEEDFEKLWKDSRNSQNKYGMLIAKAFATPEIEKWFKDQCDAELL